MTARRLRRGLGEAYADHGFVFADAMGRPIGASAFERDLKGLLAKAGLPLTHRPHDLRHTTATYLLAAGVPERVVMEILGHSNLAMTRHYEHVLGEVLVDAANRLESWMARPAR